MAQTWQGRFEASDPDGSGGRETGEPTFELAGGGSLLGDGAEAGRVAPEGDASDALDAWEARHPPGEAADLEGDWVDEVPVEDGLVEVEAAPAWAPPVAEDRPPRPPRPPRDPAPEALALEPQGPLTAWSPSAPDADAAAEADDWQLGGSAPSTSRAEPVPAGASEPAWARPVARPGPQEDAGAAWEAEPGDPWAPAEPTRATAVEAWEKAHPAGDAWEDPAEAEAAEAPWQDQADEAGAGWDDEEAAGDDGVPAPHAGWHDDPAGLDADSPDEDWEAAPQGASTSRVIRARPATVSARILAWSVDGLVLGTSLGSFAWLAGRVAGGEAALVTRLAERPLAAVALVALGATLAVLYTTLFTAAGGQTLGARLAGIRVLDGRGSTPGVGRALRRALLAVPGTLIFLVGLAWTLLDEHGQSLHDRLSGTFVVERRPGR